MILLALKRLQQDADPPVEADDEAQAERLLKLMKTRW